MSARRGSPACSGAMKSAVPISDPAWVSPGGRASSGRAAGASSSRCGEDRIQGVWRAVSYEEDGKAYPAFVFAEKVRLTMTFEGDQVTSRTEYLDPNVKAARPDVAVDNEIQGIFSLNAGANPKRLSWFR